MSEPRDPPYPAETISRGWRFEVDMESFKRSDTWKLAKTGAMRGALLLLWSEAWQEKPCGTLPDDDELIALMIDMPAATFAKSRNVLRRGWVRASDGRLYHDVITARVLAMLEKRAKDAKRTADRRARQAGVDPSSEELTDVSRVTPPGVGSEFDTKHQAPSTTEADASVTAANTPRAGRKCPKAFEPDWQWSAEHFPNVDARTETEKFRDHTFKNAISDWSGTWRNWIRRSGETRSAGQTFRERDAANAAARVAEITGGLAAAKPATLITRRNDALQEVFDATPRRLG